MKKCNKCLEVKSLAQFDKDKAHSSGHYSMCKICKKESTALWRAKNRSSYNAKMRAYNAANYQKLRLKRYNLTVEQHAKLLADQGGCCAICHKPPQGKRPLAVDHNHKTGKVRQLLCYGCNRALHVLESVELLFRAMEYLKRHGG